VYINAFFCDKLGQLHAVFADSSFMYSSAHHTLLQFWVFGSSSVNRSGWIRCRWRGQI